MLLLPGCLGLGCEDPLECDDEALLLFVDGADLPAGDYDIRVDFDDWIVVADCNKAGGRWQCAEVRVHQDAGSIASSEDYDAHAVRIDDSEVAFALAIEGNFHPLIELEEPHFDVLVERGGDTVVREEVVVPFANAIEGCDCGDVEEGEVSLAATK